MFTIFCCLAKSFQLSLDQWNMNPRLFKEGSALPTGSECSECSSPKEDFERELGGTGLLLASTKVPVPLLVLMLMLMLMLNCITLNLTFGQQMCFGLMCTPKILK